MTSASLGSRAARGEPSSRRSRPPPRELRTRRLLSCRHWPSHAQIAGLRGVKASATEHSARPQFLTREAGRLPPGCARAHLGAAQRSSRCGTQVQSHPVSARRSQASWLAAAAAVLVTLAACGNEDARTASEATTTTVSLTEVRALTDEEVYGTLPPPGAPTPECSSAGPGEYGGQLIASFESTAGELRNFRPNDGPVASPARWPGVPDDARVALCWYDGAALAMSPPPGPDGAAKTSADRIAVAVLSPEMFYLVVAGDRDGLTPSGPE
jgi:hypothetical protein